MSEKSALRRWAPVALRVVFSVAILAWLGTRVDWAHVAAAFRGLKWGYWLAAVGLYVACQLMCSLRWKWLAEPMGFQQSFTRFTGIYFVGMFFNLLLPTSVGGDAVRALYLARDTGQRMNAVLCVLLDRIGGVLVLIALACVATAMSPIELPIQIRYTVIALAAGAVLGLALTPTLAKRVARSNLPIAKLKQLATAITAARKLFRKHPRLLLGTTAISVVVQVLNAALVGLVGKAVGLEVPWVYYGVAVPLVTLLTLVPLSLNGVGLREGGMVLLLGPAGVVAADAVTLAFLWFCVQVTTSLFGAGVYLFGRFSPPEDVPGERPTVDRHSREGRASEYSAVA